MKNQNKVYKTTYKSPIGLLTLVSDKTNFDVNKIDVIEAEKTNKLENQFNRFIFKYKGKTFKLLDDELTMLDN